MSSDEVVDTVADTSASKRKRSFKEADELEIDINLPEPPSKRAKRKEKKSKPKRTTTADGEDDANGSATQPSEKPSNTDRKAARLALNDHSDLLEETNPTPSKHGEFGVWIGNLPFTAGKATIRDFLHKHAGIEESDITRLHLPGPSKQGGRKQAEQQNRGFAYVDFTTREITDRAIAVSEKLVDGRRLLIKDAKNFEGRPEKVVKENENGTAEGERGEKVPSKRVFVGNLDFEVTRDDLFDLFAPAGEVEDVFLATFEDSGKCKGFGWVTFASVTGSSAAVKGFLYREAVEDEVVPPASNSSDVEIITERKARPRRHKIWVNRINGRTIRCEFAEDKQTRYKKRFGKDKPRDNDQDEAPIRDVIPQLDNNAIVRGKGTDALGRSTDKREAFRQIFDIPDDNARGIKHGADQNRVLRPQQKGKPNKDERREERRKRHDARSVAPGQALANTQRATGAIVAGKGKKVTFD